ncbi:hypothetical protein [Microbacterium sp.]|uniref:hypothetical protein n=1 Tax=Microbacterium sp. TaxID=51671 RepID=UPI000A92EB87|nr:hypothetical protein [Microbacterium sp.]
MSESPADATAHDPQAGTARVARILMSEEAVYGLILVSGMIVVSNSVVGTSANALLSVVITVIVFFAAHVYAGTLARLAADEHSDLRSSVAAAARHSEGLLLVALLPIAVLLLGVTHLIDDEVAIWAALLVDTVVLGALGWIAVAKWTPRFWPRLASALITAAFGLVITALKAVIH